MIHNEGGITDAEKRSCNEKRRITGSSIWFQIINQIHQQDYARRQKGVAERIVYDAFDLIHSKTGKDPMEVFDAAMKNVMPTLEVKLAASAVPTTRFLLKSALTARPLWGFAGSSTIPACVVKKTMYERVAGELMDAANNTGASVKKREDTHKMAEANRAFAHYRW